MLGKKKPFMIIKNFFAYVNERERKLRKREQQKQN